MTTTGTLLLLGWEADNLSTALAERDRLIRLARADGHSVAKIAAAAKLTGPGVRLILARAERDGG